MKKVRVVTESEEPIGIIISRGASAEKLPVFWGYVWAPAPEPTVEATTKVA